MRLCVLLSLLFLGQAIWISADAKTPAGIDFYHFWLPAQARAARPADTAELGSPYTESAAYAAVLNGRADSLWRQFGVAPQVVARTHQGLAAQPPRDTTAALLQTVRQRLNAQGLRVLVDEQRFLLANLRRREIDLTATPLLYAFFWFLPADYDVATGIYGWLQFLCFFGGTVLLWHAAGGRWYQGVLLALGLMIAFQPYRSDLRVGNLNSLHLLAAALPLAAACGPLRRAAAGTGPQRTWASLTLALLAFYVLLKPSFVLLALGLTAHVAWRLGPRAFARAAIPAAVATGLLLLWPCLYFGAFSVWGDWLAYVAADTSKLAYDVDKFNTSLTLHLAGWLGGSTFLYGAVLGLAVLASLAAVLWRAARGAPRTALGLVLDRPFAAASLGIVLTLATSPLVWGHYTIVVVVVLAWALQPSATGRLPGHFWPVALAAMLYAAAYVLGVEAVRSYLRGSDALGMQTWDLSDSVRILTGIAWIPLWLGVLLLLRRAAVTSEPAPAAAPTT